MLYRWPLITVVFALSMVISLSAEAVVLTAEMFREAAVRYESGRGVKQDDRRAYRLYCVAALRGDHRAAHRLGLMHANAHAGLKGDRSIAAGWFQLAMEYGDSDANRELEKLDGVSAVPDPACPVTRGLPDRPTIETWVRLLAPEYGLDPRLVLALIAVESNFDPRALSPRNAHGLMQLLPETAKRFAVSNIWDPVQNISGGLSYLRWLMEYYSGKVRLVLSAYNAGEEAVDRYRKIPPYDETRRYVLSILVKYRKLIHPVDPLPINEIEFDTADLANNRIVMMAPKQRTPD
jgi:TPR repeat protein